MNWYSKIFWHSNTNKCFSYYNEILHVHVKKNCVYFGKTTQNISFHPFRKRIHESLVLETSRTKQNHITRKTKCLCINFWFIYQSLWRNTKKTIFVYTSKLISSYTYWTHKIKCLCFCIKLFNNEWMMICSSLLASCSYHQESHAFFIHIYFIYLQASICVHFSGCIFQDVLCVIVKAISNKF